MAVIKGTNSSESLFGTPYEDWIHGYGGNDHLYGSSRNDYLNGGKGQDTLSGGSGADEFEFYYQNESPLGSGDIILDFRGWEGDKIDLSPIDANVNWYKTGNQSFDADQLSYNSSTGILTAQVFGGADVQVQLTGAPPLDLAVDIIE